MQQYLQSSDSIQTPHPYLLQEPILKSSPRKE